MSLLRFKLDADSGDSWIVRRDPFLTEKAEVVLVFPATGFGEDVIIKEIEYTDSASGLYLQSYRLASKFGIVAEYEDLGLAYYLRGARINGVTYGTVTSVDRKGTERLRPDLVLDQNYPNPFNTSTTIPYELPHDADIHLKVYNALGEEIETLLGGYKLKGRHTFPYEPTDLPSGIFFYKLITPGGSITKKMLLIR